jgi:hypothetical protein
MRNINKYSVGSELGLSPIQTNDIANVLKARGYIIEHNRAGPPKSII